MVKMYCSKKDQSTCLLYIDGNGESELAKRVLESGHIPYAPLDLRDFESTDVSAPTLLADEGSYQGIERIQTFVQSFGWRYTASNLRRAGN